MQLALKAGVFYDKVSNMTIWGNHSTTQVIKWFCYKIMHEKFPHSSSKETLYVTLPGSRLFKC